VVGAVVMEVDALAAVFGCGSNIRNTIKITESELSGMLK